MTYRYWVRAVNGTGPGPLSDSNYGFRPAPPTPTPTPTPSPTATPTPTPTPTVRPTPTGLTAAFTLTPETPVVGGEVRFTDASANATTCAWDLGDLKTSEDRDPFHTYTLRGTCTVTLRVSDGATTAQTNTAITVGERAQLRPGK